MTEYQTTLAAHEPIAITIGNFDGVHLGHQRLMHELSALAQQLGCKPVLVTFKPHTLNVIRPEIQAQFLTTLEEKIALTRHYGKIADSIVIHFTREVASMTAEAFLDELNQQFTIKGLIVGTDFSLGRNRTGNVAFLEQYSQARGIQFRAVALEEAGPGRISSTRIRNLVSEGRISEANELLGHPMVIEGRVQHGDQRGRLLGFPTANLRPDPQKLLPANGVYVVRAHVQNGTASDSETDSPVYNGVANIGVRPTFNGKERLVEVHLLNVTLDLYDTYLSVEFIEYVRAEQRFPGVEALKTQIASDIQRANEILMSRRVSH